MKRMVGKEREAEEFPNLSGTQSSHQKIVITVTPTYGHCEGSVN